jgi:hypothetical protein
MKFKPINLELKQQQQNKNKQKRKKGEIYILKKLDIYLLHFGNSKKPL